MGRFENVEIKIVIGKNRTSYGCDPDDLFTNIEGIDTLRDEPVGEAMPAPGAIAKGS
jgi:hypothetical protein